MFRSLIPTLGALFVAISLMPISVANAQGDPVAALARRLVRQVIQPKARDLVLIEAAQESIPLAEDISNELSQVGATGIISLQSNRVVDLYYKNVDPKYDGTILPALERFHSVFSSAVLIDRAPAAPRVPVPAARAAAVYDALNAAYRVVQRHNVPIVEVGNGLTPTESFAVQFGVTKAQLADVFWSALSVDFDTLAKDATALHAAVAGKTVYVTASNGTDFTFSADPHAGLVSSGALTARDRQLGGAALDVNLPSGEVYLVPESGSLSGTVVFGDFRYRGVVVSGMTLRYANGALVSTSFGSGGEALAKRWTAMGSDIKQLSWIDIGVNRGVKKLPASTLWATGPSMAAGYVCAGLGNSERQGGTNKSPFYLASSVPYATVVVDGKKLVEGGRLAPL